MRRAAKTDAMKFDLSTRDGRHRARKAGFDVPKQKPGMKTKDFASFVMVEGDCEIWCGETNKDGYGRYHARGKTFFAHRFAWELKNGPIPPGMLLLHSCDNPACVKIGHLSMGTHSDNQADKFAKGRQAKGEGVASAILTEAQVKEIRERYSFRRVTYKMLALEYGVCKDTIQKAVRGINWGHLA